MTGPESDAYLAGGCAGNGGEVTRRDAGPEQTPSVVRYRNHKPERHEVEAYRRGYGDAVVFGWHCLTCDVEREEMTVHEATSAAALHSESATASGHAPRPPARGDYLASGGAE